MARTRSARGSIPTVIGIEISVLISGLPIFASASLGGVLACAKEGLKVAHKDIELVVV